MAEPANPDPNPDAKSNAKSAPPPMPARLFGYDVIDRIGEGAGAWVYAVNDPANGQVYALKHVVPKTEKDLRYLRQLENEYEVAKQFRNPLLRRAIDLKVNRTLFRKVIEAGLLLDLVDGIPLDKHPPLPLPQVLNIFTQAGRALAAVHYLLYVHADFKPNNILVQPDGKIRLIDFGQACRGGTIKERVQGTPDFIAPEQVRLKAVTIRTDIYAFGASLYWAVTGKNSPTLFTVGKGQRDTVLKQQFPAPAELNDRVPAPLSELIMECLMHDPLQRPHDTQELVARLGDVKL
jgi:eukaryotic-like serine/threonine-protein kinase